MTDSKNSELPIEVVKTTIKDKAVVICEYLKSFYDRLVYQSIESSELTRQLDVMIEYYSSDDVEHYCRQTIYDLSGKTKKFNVGSILYLLERRRIIIHDGALHIMFEAGALRLEDPRCEEWISSEFAIERKERERLFETLSILEGLRTTSNLKTGAQYNPTIPSSFNANWLKFSDCIFDLEKQTVLALTGDELYMTQVQINYKDIDKLALMHVRNLLLFIADYNPVTYNRMLQMMTHPYTKKNLEKMFLLVGKGGNGKGLFLQLMGRLYGSHSYTTKALSELYKASVTTKEANLSRLLPAKVGLFEEEEEFNETIFNRYYKGLADGGSENVRVLGKNGRTMANRATLYAATNYAKLGSISSDDMAFHRRMVITDFTNTFITSEDMKLVTLGLEYANLPILLKLVAEDYDPTMFDDGVKRDRNTFEQRYSDNVEGAVFRNPITQFANICDNLGLQSDMFDAKYRVKLEAVNIAGGGSSQHALIKQMKDFVTPSMIGDVPHVRFTKYAFKRYVSKDMSIEDFPFHDKIDLDKLHELSQKSIRVTKLAYDLGLR
ncbi:MAG: DUF5906 domain-containing protein, partial [Enterococcus sp.]